MPWTEPGITWSLESNWEVESMKFSTVFTEIAYDSTTYNEISNEGVNLG
jgi:hypothetical protein